MMSIDDLPPPPAGRTGWPWTVPEAELPDAEDGETLPKISVVTPSFNQGRYIEETIRSVLLQGYPNLEYLVVDGGSTDQSVEIIRKYEPWLAYWVSEKDNGQSDAINKGWKRTTGDITTWLCSDDVYRPGALFRVASAYRTRPNVAVVIGKCAITDSDLNLLYYKRAKYLDARELLLAGTVPGQPSIFFDTAILNELGYLNEDYHIVMDWEYWIRMAVNYSRDRMVLIDEDLSAARSWEGNKGSIWTDNTGNFSVLKNCNERRNVLDKLFAGTGLSAEIRQLRDQAYGHTYLYQACHQLRAWQMKAAVASWRQARRSSPAGCNMRVLFKLIARAYRMDRQLKRLVGVFRK